MLVSSRIEWERVETNLTTNRACSANCSCGLNPVGSNTIWSKAYICCCCNPLNRSRAWRTKPCVWWTNCLVKSTCIGIHNCIKAVQDKTKWLIWSRFYTQNKMLRPWWFFCLVLTWTANIGKCGWFNGTNRWTKSGSRCAQCCGTNCNSWKLGCECGRTSCCASYPCSNLTATLPICNSCGNNARDCARWWDTPGNINKAQSDSPSISILQAKAWKKTFIFTQRAVQGGEQLTLHHCS